MDSDVGRLAGIGLDRQTADGLFEAFYTIKPDGMGMGLSVSRSIIENHGGKLYAEANDDQGATFSFSIPGLAHRSTDERSGALSGSDTRPAGLASASSPGARPA